MLMTSSEAGSVRRDASHFSVCTNPAYQVGPPECDDDMGLYTYVGNDPVNAADPSGTACEFLNQGTSYCRRARLYGAWDHMVAGRTRFFAAASATVRMLATSAYPVVGSMYVSQDTRAYLGALSSYLESANRRMLNDLQHTGLRGQALDAALVSREQSHVQRHLDAWKAEDPNRYGGMISEVNDMLNGGQDSPFATDDAYMSILEAVRRHLGGDINFEDQAHREAIGNALIDHVRATGGCDVAGSRIKGC